jgi:hypothetical protein
MHQLTGFPRPLKILPTCPLDDLLRLTLDSNPPLQTVAHFRWIIMVLGISEYCCNNFDFLQGNARR